MREDHRLQKWSQDKTKLQVSNRSSHLAQSIQGKPAMGPRGPSRRRKETLAERESMRTGPATGYIIRLLETQQHRWRLDNAASLGLASGGRLTGLQ